MKQYTAFSLFIIYVLSLVIACGGSAPSVENPKGRPDHNFDAAAQKLGVTVDELRNALGGPPPDIRGAALILGISENQLKEALDHPGKRRR